MITYKTDYEIERMKRAGDITFYALKAVKEAIRPGITTKALDTIAETVIRDHGAVPNFLGYNGFPGSICASINEQVVHGIPSEQVVLKEGQIISIDCGAIVEGYHGDAARTYGVGEISQAAQELIERTRQSFYEGIQYARTGYRIGDISHAIEQYVTPFNYGVIRSLCGHGIGQAMHEDPDVPNFGRAGHGPRLRPGLAIAVEPMISAGTYEVYCQADRWAYATRDHSLAAHYENSICIRPNGEAPLMLTIPDGEEDI